MNRIVNIALFVSLSMVITMVGCHWQKAPKGFPKTVPFNMIVTHDAKPVSGATVILTPEERPIAWSVSGKTDDAGVVNLQTIQGTYVRNGVPLGNFRITISKIPDVSQMTTVVNDGSDKAIAEYNAEVAKLRAEHPSEVPEFFETLESSPLKTEVTKNGEFKVELTDYSEE